MHAFLDKLVLVSPSCLPPNSALSSSWRAVNRRPVGSSDTVSAALVGHALFLSCLPPLYFLPLTWSNGFWSNENKPNANKNKINMYFWWRRFSVCQVFRFLSPRQFWDFSPRAHCRARNKGSFESLWWWIARCNSCLCVCAYCMRENGKLCPGN